MQLFSVAGKWESAAAILVKDIIMKSINKYSNSNFIEMLWILTRKRKPSRKTLSDVDEVIADNHLSKSALAKTEHENCESETDFNGLNFNNRNWFNLLF